jgi:hypothetical protein
MYVLKKPQRVSMRKFVCFVEQVKAYIVQLPCFYNSPSANTTTTLTNILLTKADLTSHILQMCPFQWQDQYNLYRRGMTPLDMCLLITSFEAIAIEHVCTQEKASAYSKKISNNGEKSNKQPGTDSTARVPTKKLAPRSIGTYARGMGVHILHTIQEIVVSMTRAERRKPISVLPRKAERNPIPHGNILCS